MPGTLKVSEIIELVSERLEKAAKERGIHIAVRADESKMEDDWIYVSVAPTRPGERASDHAELMSLIEKQLRAEGIERLLLVPVIDD